jgi:poly(glycerol-phosphate) alpha-glucosyltransferase
MNNTKVDFVTCSISRSSGGMFYSINSLARALIERKCRLNVYSSNANHSSLDENFWDGANLFLFDEFFKTSFSYLKGIRKSIGDSNSSILHVHGLWKYTSCISSEFYKKNKPYIVSPHGMLDSWAIAKSSIKKNIAFTIYFLRCYVLLC